MTSRQTNIWLLISFALIYGSMIAAALMTHGVSESNPNKVNALELLRACTGEVEIIAAPNALLIGCGPAKPAAKAPTAGSTI